MARKSVKVKECDRCAKRTPATGTHRFTYDGTDYEIDLCDPHADSLQRDMFGWTRLAREVDRAAIFTEDDRATMKRVSHMAKPMEHKEFKRVELPPDIPKPVGKWTLSRAANEQLIERGPDHGIKTDDVYLTCVLPQRMFESLDQPGRFRYEFNNCCIVVQPSTRTVITVAPGPNEWTWGREIEYSPDTHAVSAS